MKVQAYKCDSCENIKEEKYMVCVLPVEDAFDALLSFPLHLKSLDGSNIHYCLDCYNSYVTIPLSTIDRGGGPEEWEAKRKELSYILRRKCVTNAIRRKRK